MMLIFLVKMDYMANGFAQKILVGMKKEFMFLNLKMPNRQVLSSSGMES